MTDHPHCSADSGVVPERESFWLLEMVGHQKYASYTSPRNSFVHSWTKDVWQAGRFRDERDAHEVWRMLEKAERERWKPVEHMFINKVITPDEPQGVSVWQPIETAPQDGSEILILTSTGVTQARFAPGEWHDHPEGREYEGPVWVCCDDQWQIEIEDCGKDGMHHGMATHWMTLPASPLSRPQRSQGETK